MYKRNIFLVVSDTCWDVLPLRKLPYVSDCAGEEASGVVDPAVLAVDHRSVISLSGVNLGM